MKVISNTIRYQCDFCKKEYKKGFQCVKHENKCYHNPLNQPKCSDCDFLEKVKKDVAFENESGDMDFFESNAFFCKKKQIGIYPPKVEQKGLLEKYPDAFVGEERMPVDCDLYEFNPGF